MTSDLIQEAIAYIRSVEDPELVRAIQVRWNSLTKPVGSLGKLETLVLRYGLIRGTAMPSISNKGLFIFCADHGVTAEGVSAYPAEVTGQMVRNFLRGGAAINVLCRQFTIKPVVVDVGVRGGTELGVVQRKIAPGTRNFTREEAMTAAQAVESVEIGIRLAQDAAAHFDVLGAGEMGIGNSTTAAALLSAFSGRDPAETAGRGTGINDADLAAKLAVIRTALRRHQPDPGDPLDVLKKIGGLEIGATAGLILGAAAVRVPVVLDGFISCTAALVARALSPHALDTVIFSHRSAEPGHKLLLHLLGVEPLFELDMRLGEGTGAALAINLLEASIRLYREMATFQDAAVSEAARTSPRL